MNERIYFNFQIALEAIKANKFRSLLTALGIIFGVAAVIAMLAIGSGAKQEILEQIKLVGVNNIVITPLKEQSEEKVEDNQKEEKKKINVPWSNFFLWAGVLIFAAILGGITKFLPVLLFENFYQIGRAHV